MQLQSERLRRLAICATAQQQQHAAAEMLKCRHDINRCQVRRDAGPHQRLRIPRNLAASPAVGILRGCLEHQALHGAQTRDMRSNEATQRESVENTSLSSSCCIVIDDQRSVENCRGSRCARAFAIPRIVEEDDVCIARQGFKRLAPFNGPVEHLPAAENDERSAFGDGMRG